MTAIAVILLFSGNVFLKDIQPAFITHVLALQGFVSPQQLLTLLPGDGLRSASTPCLQPGVENCTKVYIVIKRKS